MKVEIKKFGDILTSRPAGREAGLAIRAYLKPQSKEKLELDFSGVLAVGPSWLDEVLTILKNEYGEDHVICLPSKNQSLAESIKIIDSYKSEHLSKKESIIHRWRLCPEGQYWRSKHIQPTYTKGDGTVVHRHPVSAGCCDNPSKKDQIYSEELERIAKKYFESLDGPPVNYDLDFPNGNLFDTFIRGWTRFWNEVMRPVTPLDPNFVKALIATESGFRANINTKDSAKNGYARGLMQVLDSSLKILGDKRGELEDHFVHVNQKDIHEPNLNIAAGIRWLFEKKRLASSKLNREASWEEAVANYKGILRRLINDPDHPPKSIRDLRDYYKRLIAK